MPNTNQGVGIPSLRVNLSHHSDKFSASNLEITITKKVNFIFGKNGTGKTTIADEIQDQLSTDYDVFVFKDFDGVAENDRLNAVALGTENAKIQKKIDNIDGEIAEIEKQISPPEDTKTENLFTKAAKSKEEFEKQEKTIDTFFTSVARQIKNQSNPQIAKATYDKSSFQKDIVKANLLLDDSINTYKNIIKADKKVDVTKPTFPTVGLSDYLESANEILESNVTQRQGIPELKEDVQKQSFARQGMEIHDHKNGEVCAFCGNEISEERWQLLGNYFNDEVKKLENRIASEITKISLDLDAVKSIEGIKEGDFYDKFKKDAKHLNMQIATKKNEYREFLNCLQNALTEKKKNLFIKSAPLKIEIPQNFDNISEICGTLVTNHNNLSLNLETEQEEAKDALRYHEIKKKLDEFKYGDENIKLARFETASGEAKKELEDKRGELQAKQDKRKALILQTKDEEKIAEKINKLLTGMGVISFLLKLVENDDENQKGQYQIEGYDKSIRPITKLSKGEKNIIAFLYFIFSLESIDNKNKPKIIVLDDPMTSNDDTMQYLMIGEIQKLYRGIKDGNYIVLFTHNCHFYLNVRPNAGATYQENGREISFYEKYGVYHLFSDGKLTTIKSILKGKQDFQTSYETLWKELVFLYKTEDAAPDLMLGPCRKICETYMNFMKKGIEAFYGDNMNAKKLFDVNQHSIDDFEAEANGKTKDEIKNILHNLFNENGAKDHIDSYWKAGAL